MQLDAVILSRLQFAFVMSFHIVFPSFTIGLASYLAFLEGMWLRFREERYLRLYFYWLRIFAIAFGMGVVSGVVMSYQFGTNWSRFSQITGNVLGPLLGYEVMMAFFLEASFLGIMLFGYARVGERLHFAATCVVGVGTLISAFWIMAANSWMQTPAGYVMEDARFVATSWPAVIFNPSFPIRYVHMVLGAFLSTALVVAGVGAFHLLRGRTAPAVITMTSWALGTVALLAPLQILAGHTAGETVRTYQPAKLAAMEGHWETHHGNAPLVLFAWPDEKDETNLYEIAIPRLGSLVVTNSWTGTVRGLKEWPASDRPPVGGVFWSFRVMVGLGFAMTALGAWGAWALWSNRLVASRWLLRLALPMGPAGFIAILAGWYTAEVGRQPYTVYGLLRTADSVSPILARSVGLSLTVFVIVYGVVFAAGLAYLLALMRQSPDDTPLTALPARQVGALRGTPLAAVESEGFMDHIQPRKPRAAP
jgi:cytochrome bd ubiquinol oxidase subunit I